MARPAVLCAALALVVTVVGGGCSREFGPGESGPAGYGSASPLGADAARTKLRLQLQDPCYAGDARAAWPRCARWVEETTSSARAAVGARPDDPALRRTADEVAAGRDAFLGRGCGPVPSASADVAECVAALTTTRERVRALAGGLGVPGA